MGIVSSIGYRSEDPTLENRGALGRDEIESLERALEEWEEGARHTARRERGRGRRASQSQGWDTGIGGRRR